MIKSFLKTALVTTALLSTAGMSYAQEVVTWWDFLGGGDGVRMKALIEKFNTEMSGKIEIQPTTLEWGTPFYTKVQTSAAIGEGPDIMTYHLSRIPLGVQSGALSPLTPEELTAAGIKPDDFEAANWQAAQVDGAQYAVPLDIHSAILYYNKDILSAAGLLDADGKPMGLDSAANFDANLKTLTHDDQVGLSLATADGATIWRVFYSLLNQDDGKFFADGTFLDGDSQQKAADVLTEMASWVANGYTPANTEYPASIALFTSGKAAFTINGVWEVPTMVDLEAKGELFNWGAVRIPVLYGHAATWADSHAFAIPNRVGNEVSPEKRAAVLQVIHWFNENSLDWAGGGHLPAFSPIRDGAEFKALKPNSDYSDLAATAVFDPVTVLAGVASPVYDAAGNYLMPAMNGEMDPADAVQQLKDDLQGQVE